MATKTESTEQVAQLQGKIAALEARVREIEGVERRFYLADGSVVLLEPEQVVELRKVAARILGHLAEFAPIAHQRRIDDNEVLGRYGDHVILWGDCVDAAKVLAGKVPA